MTPLLPEKKWQKRIIIQPYRKWKFKNDEIKASFH